MHYIDADSAHSLFTYPELVEQLLKAHQTPTEVIEDLLIESEYQDLKNHFFLRTAWQKGHYLGSKNITIFPQNRDPDGPPAIQALYTLFDGNSGSALCCLDGTALTFIKTATDSALATHLLAKKDIKTMLMIGAGGMAPHLIEAHCALRPSIENIYIFNRTQDRCIQVVDKLAKKAITVTPISELDEAIPEADLICSAVTTAQPYVKGKLLKPGVHIDLIGAFTEELREADNETIRRGTVFVDSRRMTLGIVGEIVQPIKQGVMTADDIKADFYDAVNNDLFCRSYDDEITVFKNGGGGHLDLMMAHILYNRFIQQQSNEQI